MSLNVKQWEPAADCPRCKRAAELFREHASMAAHAQAKALAKIKEQSAEIARLQRIIGRLSGPEG